MSAFSTPTFTPSNPGSSESQPPHTQTQTQTRERPPQVAGSMEQKGGGPLVLVKVGGSAITDKATLEILKERELREFARQVAEVVQGGVRLVLVHGAGSFGHFQARQFRVKTGKGYRK